VVLAESEPHLVDLPPEQADWYRRVGRAFTIESVYTGLEAVLRDIAADIDGSVPGGADWHATLLEQMAAGAPGIRPALLSPGTRELLDYLRRFRHVVRINYGLDLDSAKVADSLAVMERLLPAFETDLAAFEATLCRDGPAGEV
jgi:hypothetical protein